MGWNSEVLHTYALELWIHFGILKHWNNVFSNRVKDKEFDIWNKSFKWSNILKTQWHCFLKWIQIFRSNVTGSQSPKPWLFYFIFNVDLYGNWIFFWPPCCHERGQPRCIHWTLRWAQKWGCLHFRILLLWRQKSRNP